MMIFLKCENIRFQNENLSFSEISFFIFFKKIFLLKISMFVIVLTIRRCLQHNLKKYQIFRIFMKIWRDVLNLGRKPLWPAKEPKSTDGPEEYALQKRPGERPSSVGESTCTVGKGFFRGQIHVLTVRKAEN